MYSLRTIEDLKPGDHLCCIYQAEEEHRALLSPFLRQGLDQNEKVIYVADSHAAETILEYLREDGVDVESCFARGQLSVLTREEAYMREGIFDPDRMIALLQKETQRAIDEGYAALRVTGEMTWALHGLPGSDRLVEYEAKLNEFFPGSRCLAICQYDGQRFGADVLLGVLRAHPIAVIGTEICGNFYYIPPDELLGDDLPAVELGYWLQRLIERKRAQEELTRYREYLEELVAERTAELTQVNEQLLAEITEREQTEEALRQESRVREAEMAVRVRVAQMDEPRDLSNVVQEIHGQLDRLGIAHDSTSIQVVNSEGTDFVSIALAQPEIMLWEDVADRALQGSLPGTAGMNAERYSWVIETWKTGKPRYDPCVPEELGFVPGGSLVDVPFSHGTLGVNSQGSHAFSKDDIALLGRFARVLSEGFQRFLDIAKRKQEEEKAQRLLNQQIIMTQLALQLGSASDLHGAYHTIYEHVCGLMDADTFMISLYDEDQQRILGEYVITGGVVRETGNLPPISLEKGHDTESQVIRTGEPLYVADWREVTERMRGECKADENGTLNDGPPCLAAWRNSIRSALMVPMKAEGETIGVMQVQSHQVDAYSQEDMDLLSALANVAAIAIQNVRLLGELQRSHEELEAHRHHLEELVEARTADLEAANEELKDFAYVVSHDLKAPLRGIAQLANWISFDYAHVLDEGGRRLLDLLIGRTKRMDSLINGILQYSRIGRVKEEEEEVDVDRLVQEIIETLSPPESILVCIEDKLPVVRVDRTRVHQVFQNLLSNAIRFMDKPKGEVKVACRDAGTHWQFSVTDNGPGIEEAHCDRIFRIFETLAPRDQVESTGIGLALVKKIVKRWGGEIWVESEWGVGSIFYFTLPREGTQHER
jgi:signal transduction histidine kinase